jgi:hypothetical protein
MSFSFFWARAAVDIKADAKRNERLEVSTLLPSSVLLGLLDLLGLEYDKAPNLHLSMQLPQTTQRL